MIFFLDTDTCIYYLNGTYRSINQRLDPLYGRIRIPSMVKAELLFGALHSDCASANLERVHVLLGEFEVVPFCSRAAQEHAQAQQQLTRKGLVVGRNDLVIAATALAHEGTLVTHNVSEFKMIPRLMIEDWVRA